MISTYHTNGISFMEFTKKEPLLVTIGAREDSPITIYNIQTQEIKYSFHVKSHITSLITPILGSFDIDSERPPESFIGVAKEAIYYISIEKELEVECFE